MCRSPVMLKDEGVVWGAARATPTPQSWSASSQRFTKLDQNPKICRPINANSIGNKLAVDHPGWVKKTHQHHLLDALVTTWNVGSDFSWCHPLHGSLFGERVICKDPGLVSCHQTFDEGGVILEKLLVGSAHLQAALFAAICQMMWNPSCRTFHQLQILFQDVVHSPLAQSSGSGDLDDGVMPTCCQDISYLGNVSRIPFFRCSTAWFVRNNHVTTLKSPEPTLDWWPAEGVAAMDLSNPVDSIQLRHAWSHTESDIIPLILFRLHFESRSAKKQCKKRPKSSCHISSEIAIQWSMVQYGKVNIWHGAIDLAQH